jgi:hypothetical protein
MKNLPRTFLILAFFLALAASLLILSSSSHITETTVYEDGAQETTVRQLSWYQAQGTWGVMIVLIFAVVYALPYFLSSKDFLALAAHFALLALVLTWMAIFSIGPYYFPSAGALILSYMALGVARIRQ